MYGLLCPFPDKLLWLGWGTLTDRLAAAMGGRQDLTVLQDHMELEHPPRNRRSGQKGSVIFTRHQLTTLTAYPRGLGEPLCWLEARVRGQDTGQSGGVWGGTRPGTSSWGPEAWLGVQTQHTAR